MVCVIGRQEEEDEGRPEARIHKQLINGKTRSLPRSRRLLKLKLIKNVWKSSKTSHNIFQKS